MNTPDRCSDFSFVAAAAAISWPGLGLHNVADLPGQAPWSPESAYPAIVLVGLLVLYRSRLRTLGRWLLLGWALLHLLGGAMLSIVPLPPWPFDPEQSPRHYAFHVLYGLTQIPLVVVTLRHPPAAGGGCRRGTGR